MENRIHEVICELLGAIQKSGLDVRGEVVFAEACSIYRGEKAAEGRWGYLEHNKTKKDDSTPLKTPSGTLDTPTTKQIAFLNKNKVKIPTTKEEATKMIATYINNQNNI